MKLSRNQHGTGIVELLLVLIILGAVGFTGWYVWNSKQVTEDLYNNTKTEQAATTASRTCNLDPNKVGTLYTAPANVYRVCLPNGWQVAMTEGASVQGSALVASADGLIYNAKTAAQVGQVGGGDGARAFAIFYNQDYDGSSTDGYTNTGELKIGSATGTTYYREETKEDDGFIGSVAKGTKQYLYQFKHDRKTIDVSYNIFPGDTDNSALINEVAKSLRFID